MDKSKPSYISEWFNAVLARWYGTLVILIILFGATAFGAIWLSSKGLEWWWTMLFALAIVIFTIFNYIAYRRVAIERDKARQNLKTVEQSQSPITTTKNIQSRIEAIESAKLAWGLWHTGHRMKIEGLIKKPSLQRILVLNPSSVAEVVRRAGEAGQERIINEIKETTTEALANQKEIRLYSNYRESSLTIYDTNPIVDKDGILKPISDNAWMHITYLLPNVGIDQWKVDIIFNKGNDKQIFAGYFKEYEFIWNEDSIPASQS